jgi:hypothetical protein
VQAPVYHEACESPVFAMFSSKGRYNDTNNKPMDTNYVVFGSLSLSQYRGNSNIRPKLAVSLERIEAINRLP